MILIITETIFSLILAASVAAVGALAYDLKTDKLRLDKYDPFNYQSSSEKSDSKDKDNNNEENKSSSQTSENSSSQSESTPESSVPDKSQESKDESSAEASESSENSGSDAAVIRLLSEPENLEANPPELIEKMERNNYSLDLVDGDRLILVDANDSDDITKAKLYCYQKSEKTGLWWNVAGEGKTLSDQVYIGSGGSEFEVPAGSKKTPGGLLSAGEGFYIKDRPATEYPLFEITEDTYWVTDPESVYYNQKTTGTDNKDWDSADHMITSEKSYKYGLVINFNTDPVDKTQGSGIFIHCGSNATEGSVAVPENVMKTILMWLEKDSRVSVFITV